MMAEALRVSAATSRSAARSPTSARVRDAPHLLNTLEDEDSSAAAAAILACASGASFILERTAMTLRSASQEALNSAMTSCASASSASSSFTRSSRDSLLPVVTSESTLVAAASFSAACARFSAVA